ncbi:uncharacterized protein MEPE_05102 [Melanopsichium pennsylvanicum]|uniref:Uncharacterized protein n=1 Tax=Melanopsichium pennsylvanicum TaxID=63383 RepID=A0AAJ4XSQ2_9BASI|nr:uncharacterized protein MEPE_05102 [Melanopsichium pennsylvanicum]
MCGWSKWDGGPITCFAAEFEQAQCSKPAFGSTVTRRCHTLPNRKSHQINTDNKGPSLLHKHETLRQTWAGPSPILSTLGVELSKNGEGQQKFATCLVSLETSLATHVTHKVDSSIQQVSNNNLKGINGSLI